VGNAGNVDLTLIGYRAGANVTTNGASIAIGNYALEEATGDNSETVAIGYQAAQNADDFKESVAIGYRAGRNSFGYNVAIGYLSQENGGDFNASVGYAALRAGGSESIGVGAFAGGDAGGTGNTFLGYGAGGAISSGNKNIFVGYNPSSNNVSNCIVIGNEVTVPSGFNNQINIGDVFKYASTSGITLSSSTNIVGTLTVNGSAVTGFTGSAGANGSTGTQGPIGFVGSAGTGSSYNQSLNTTDNVTFSQVTATSTVSLTGYRETVFNRGNTTGTVVIDAATATIHLMTLTGNVTINGFSTSTQAAGQSAVLVLTQDGTGNRRLTTSTMKFAGGVNVLSTAGGSVDLMNIFYDGTTYYATLARGYV
jgi:hypothetical protein